MIRLFASTLLLLSLLCLPVNGSAVEELRAIKMREATGKIYDRTIEFFTKKIPEAFEKRLTNAYKYIDLITEIFNEKGIPNDIAYLPLIESGFSPFAVGAGDAVGLWQFMKGTAQKYGLKVDRYVDERKDPVKSTQAAARYLKDLYRSFGAWDLALAAYNAGEGKVKSFYKGKTVSLPDFINRYLAQFAAASTIAQDPGHFGLTPSEDTQDNDYLEITTGAEISLKMLAEKYDTTVKAIRELNPALLTDYTPPYAYTMRLPNP
jgi:membrane-bound lytic murein transglycosylase D